MKYLGKITDNKDLVTKEYVDGAVSGVVETDPTVPSWAKASSKPSYTASEVGAIPTSDKQSYASASSLNWNSLSADQKAMVPTIQGLAFWNGAYDGSSSNLRYSANGSIIGTGNLSSSGNNHTYSISANSVKSSSFTISRAGYYPICIDRINLGGTGSDKICLNKYGITARSNGSVTYEVAYYNPTATAYTNVTVAVYVLWAKI